MIRLKPEIIPNDLAPALLNNDRRIVNAHVELDLPELENLSVPDTDVFIE